MKTLLIVLYLLSIILGFVKSNPIGFLAAMICVLIYYIIDVFENPEEP